MADETKRVRRDKKTILTEKLQAVEMKIGTYETKLAKLKETKEALEKQIQYANDAMAQKVAKKQQKEIIDLIAKSGLSLEQLSDLLNKKE